MSAITARSPVTHLFCPASASAVSHDGRLTIAHPRALFEKLGHRVADGPGGCLALSDATGRVHALALPTSPPTPFHPTCHLRRLLVEHGLQWGLVGEGECWWLIEAQRSLGGLAAEPFGPADRPLAALRPEAFASDGWLAQALADADRQRARATARRAEAAVVAAEAVVRGLFDLCANDLDPERSEDLERATRAAVQLVLKLLLEGAGAESGVAGLPSPDLLPTERTMSATWVDLAAAVSGWPPLDAGALGTIYEALLAQRAVCRNGRVQLEPSGRARRAKGAYYTPVSVVRAIVSDALTPLLDTAAAETSDRWRAGERDEEALWEPFLSIRVLDPALGSGSFLAAAGEAIADRLLATPHRASPADPWFAGAMVRRRVAERCLHGVDADPLALALARWTLGRQFGASAGPRLRYGEALLGRRCDETAPALADVRAPADGPPPCHWPLAFPEAHFGAAGLRPDAGFDAIVGNPPFLSVKRGHLARHAAALRQRFELARGQWDAYMLFVEQSLGLLRGGGRLGFVLPRPALVNEHAARMRRFVLERGSITRVVGLGLVFGGADVETVAVTIERGGADRDVLVADLEPLGAIRRRARIPAAWVRRSPGCRIPLGLEQRDLATLDRLEAASWRLRDVATVTRGLEIGKRHAAIVGQPGPDTVPLLRGEDVSRYDATPAAWLRPDALADDEQKDPALFEPRPKLLVRRVASRPIAALETDGSWVLNTLYVVRPLDANIDLAWLLAVINSATAAYWLRKSYGGDERLFPYLRQSQLLDLPLPAPDPGLAQMAREMSRRPSERLASRIDAAVAAGYGLEAESTAA